MGYIKKLFLAVFVSATLLTPGVGLLAEPVAATATDVLKNSCDGSKDNTSALCDGGDKELFGADSVFKKITDVFLFLVGAISIIMIVVGGFRYTISNGNEASIKSAKSTIVNSLIGLVVALLAYAIVEFVLFVL